MIYLPLLVTVTGSVMYHVVQKYLAPNANPVLVLLVTYVVAFAASLLLFVFFPLKDSLQVEVSRIGVPNIILGASIILIEVGWILAYRAGLNVNVGSLIGNLMVALVLIPVGLLLFREHLTLTNVAGIVLCIVGLILINQR
jgi:drug/metabolite transporter (DMT)-like permease